MAMTRNVSICIRLAATAVVLLATLVAPDSSVMGQNSQEIRLRKGDTVKLEVPQRAELSRTLTIDQKGEVSLPLIGAVRLEGLTVEEAKAAVLHSLQELYPSVQSVTVVLLGERARRFVYVQGLVAQPGKYELEATANVWDAIKEAGGPTGAAGLEAVRLIRMETDTAATSIVDLQHAIDTGDFKSLPVIKPGDTIIVPERSTSYAGAASVNVIGAVLHPGPYALTGERRLVEAILAAGGPLESANLRKVKIIREKPGGGLIMMEVDFRRFIEKGDARHNPVVLPNDTVSIPSKSLLGLVFTTPAYLVGILTAVGTTMIVYLFTR
jgi:polysaccharide export outer membrane protein